MARKRPDLLNELRALWEDWNRGMLPVPDRMIPATFEFAGDALVAAPG